MPKKQTKPKYPKTVYAVIGTNAAGVPIFDLVRLAKVKRTVTVE